MNRTADQHRACNHPRMRRLNEVGLLDFLRRNGPASRVEIAGKLGLDTKTITNVSRDLLRRKMLETVGLVSRGRGRPRQMLRVCASGIHAVGLHLAEHEISGAVIGFDGTILVKHQAGLDGQDDQKTLVAKIRRLAQGLVRAHPRALGIGLVSPGIWDDRQRKILRCAHVPAWEGVALGEVFDGLWNGPVYFESYSRAKALAEHWFGAARELEDFVLLDAGEGIGCAVVQGGKLQAGHSHMAGEIGHCVVRPGGQPCACGQRGCLETVASLAVIRAEIARRTGGNPAAMTVPAMTELLAAGQAEAVAVVRDAAQTMGLLVAHLANLLNPSHIVLAGATFDLGDCFLNPLREAVNRYTVPVIRERLKLERGQLGDAGALLGAGAAALRAVFKA